MSIEIAFRTNAYEVTSIWEQWVADQKAAWAEYREWAEKVAPGFKPFVTGRIGGKLMCAGLAFAEDDWKRSPGDLWRMPTSGRKTDLWVPNKRTKEGKALARSLDALPQPCNPAEKLPGMPGLVIAENFWYRPMVGTIGDALYAAWAIDITDTSRRLSFFTRTDKVDPTIWERIKLSEFYAAKEAAEAVNA